MTKTLTQRIRDAAQPEQTSVPEGVGDTAALSRLISAKSGKQTEPGGIRKSTIAEGQAIDLGQAQLAQQKAQEDLAQESISARESELDTQAVQQQKAFDTAKEQQKQQIQLKTDAALNQYATGMREIKSRRDVARLEQIGFAIRLRNDQYVTKIKQIGDRNRLDNEAEFKKELAQKTFSDNEALYKNDLAFRAIMDADQREFEQELANMGLSFATEIAESSTRAASVAQTAQGIQGAFSGGLQAYGKMEESKIEDSRKVKESVNTEG